MAHLSVRNLFKPISACMQALLFAVSIQNATAASITIDGWKVEYWRNHPISHSSDAFSRAVIAIHGIQRNADDYYDRIMTAAQTEKVLDHTLVVAPKFKTLDDSPDADELYWSRGGWVKGFKSTNGNRTPSFAVIDHILDRINENFPNVIHVSVVGHSAGGQFAQRYGVLNGKEQVLRSELDVRYVVANPGSYLYLTSERPLSTAKCPDYDLYKYGLSDLPGTLAYTRLDHSNIRHQALGRQFHLLLGNKDIGRDNDLDKSCMADAQGLHRYERGTRYYEYIKKIDLSAAHYKHDIVGVGHSSKEMFNSTVGREIILHLPSSTDSLADSKGGAGGVAVTSTPSGINCGNDICAGFRTSGRQRHALRVDRCIAECLLPMAVGQ